MFEEYLGDGVYAEFDGYQIWLGLAPGHKMIALEPGVYERLKDYGARRYGRHAVTEEDTGE